MRLKSIDALRGFGIITVVLSHSAHYWANDVQTFPFYLIASLSISAAPIFMIFVGVSINFTIERNKTKGQTDRKIRNVIIKRGIFLICFGYIYNLIVEASIFYLPLNLDCSENSVLNLIYLNATFWDWLVLFGIFQIIGLGLILSYFLLKISKKMRLFLAMIVLLINIIITYSPLLFGSPPYRTFQVDWHYIPSINPLRILLDILFYGQFPIIPWMFYFIVGTIFGELLLEHVKINKFKEFYKKYNRKFLILSLSGFSLLFLLPVPDFFPDSTIYVIFTTSIVFSLYFIFFNFYEIKKIKSNKVDYVFLNVGKFTLDLYLISSLLTVDLFLLISNVIGKTLLGNLLPTIYYPLTFSYVIIIILISNIWAKKNFKYSLSWLERKITR
ncbi:MAG: heparan-alpha-glucosaminide N-acetyltransferase domain-containing protein [Promethearchaeota archaeon]